MIGHIVWTDLTVPDADKVRDFYTAVVGLMPDGVEMDGYQDYIMKADGEAPPANGAVGVCHARGPNADMPPVWMIYFAVKDLDQSLTAVDQLGGKRVGDIRAYGDNRFCVIEDPAGAVCALFEATASA